MPEFYSRVDYKYDGGDRIFSIPFPYMDKSHIVVFINNDIENPVTEYEWLNETQIQINSEIKSGDKVSIWRNTSIENKLATFTDNNILDSETQNIAQEQVFNVVQEVKDSQDSLNLNMSDFIKLENTLRDNIETISESKENVEEAIDMVQEAQELVEGISQTYQDVQETVNKGLTVNVTHNMFAIEVFDRKLTDIEAIGLGEQGSKQLASDYPDSYDTLVNEFLNGTIKIYIDNEAATYSKKYTGSITGEFYTSSSTELAQGVEIFSDETCSTSLGTLGTYKNIEANKYTGSITDEFYTEVTDTLKIGQEVYSDRLLFTSLGTVNDIQEVNVNEYELTTTGKIYLPVTKNLSEGEEVYQDPRCTASLGKITFLGTVESDKYYLANSENPCFYVPKGITVTKGTEIFLDAALTISLGKVAQKGINLGESYYYYRITKQGVPFVNHTLNSWSASSSTSRYWYCYTKKPLSKEIQPYYVDKACTETRNQIKHEVSGTAHLVTIYSSDLSKKTYLGGESSAVYLAKQIDGGYDYDYIILENDEAQTKYEFYKQATVTAEVIKLNNSTNYETYKLTQTINKPFIQIGELDYQGYTLADKTSSISIQIGENEVEEVTYNGLTSSDGIVFEYSEYTNGHKIVDSKYKTAYESLELTDMYMLDTALESFILPKLDLTKNIYFVVGNIQLNNAGINTLTKWQFYDGLAECIKHSDVELLDEMSEVVSGYTEELKAIKEALEIAEDLTEDITEEL